MPRQISGMSALPAWIFPVLPLSSPHVTCRFPDRMVPMPFMLRPFRFEYVFDLRKIGGFAAATEALCEVSKLEVTANAAKINCLKLCRCPPTSYTSTPCSRFGIVQGIEEDISTVSDDAEFPVWARQSHYPKPPSGVKLLFCKGIVIVSFHDLLTHQWLGTRPASNVHTL